MNDRNSLLGEIMDITGKYTYSVYIRKNMIGIKNKASERYYQVKAESGTVEMLMVAVKQWDLKENVAYAFHMVEAEKELRATIIKTVEEKNAKEYNSYVHHRYQIELGRYGRDQVTNPKAKI